MPEWKSLGNGVLEPVNDAAKLQKAKQDLQDGMISGSELERVKAESKAASDKAIAEDKVKYDAEQAEKERVRAEQWFASHPGDRPKE